MNKIDAAGAEREFSNSKVKDHLRDMIGILKLEDVTSYDGISVPDPMIIILDPVLTILYNIMLYGNYVSGL